MATPERDVFAALRTQQPTDQAVTPSDTPTPEGPRDVFAPLRPAGTTGPLPSIRQDNTFGEEFTAGLGSGIDSLQGSLFGVAGLMGRELGIKSLEDAGNKGAQENFEEAGSFGRDSAGFSEIQDAGGFFKWTAATLGEAIPSLALAFTGAGVGAAVGRKSIELGVKRAVAKKVERDLVKLGFTTEESLVATRGLMNSEAGKKQIAEAFVNKGRAIDKFKGRAAVRGSQAGAVAVSALPQIGAIDQELLSSGVVDPGLTAVLGGVLGGALEAIPALRLMDKLFPGVDRQVSKTFVKDFAVATGTQAALEGSTEAAQEMIQLAALAYHDPSFDMFSADARTRIVDAFAAGAIVGAVTGGGAEAVGQISGSAKQGAKVAKPAIAAWTMDTVNKAGNVVEDALPEGFVPADNTVFQEIKSRVFGAVQPGLESAVNSMRNQFQGVVDAVDEHLEGGVNPETAKFSQLVAAAHNKFVEDHKQQLDDAKAYLNKQAQFIYETAQQIKDPVQRDKFIEENVAAGKEKLSGLIERLRRAAAVRDQKVEAEVDNMDLGDEILNADFTVDEEGTVVQNDANVPSDTASNVPDPGEVESAPVLTFGKNQKTPSIAVSGEEEVVGYDSRQQAEEKGLPALRRDFPEATDQDFEIREQEDGTFVIETVNPELRDTQRFNEDFRSFRDKGNSTKDKNKKFKIPKRVFEGKGTKFTSPIVDIVEMGFKGLNKGARTVQQGLADTVGDMLNRGFLDNDSANEILNQFDENFNPDGKSKTPKQKKAAKKKEGPFAPVGKFPNKGVAQAEMINFQNSLKERGITVPFDMFGPVENEDGTWGYGIVDKPKARALRAKNPTEFKALQSALKQQRRQDFLADEAAAGNELNQNTLDQDVGTQTLNRPGVEGTARVSNPGDDAGPARIRTTGKIDEGSGRRPITPIIESQATELDILTGEEKLVTLKKQEDTTPQADDRVTDPKELPSEFDTVDQVADDVAQRRKRRANANARELNEQDRKILKDYARTAKVKVLFGIDFATDGALTSAVKNLVGFVQKTLGLENDIIVMDDVGLAALIESGTVSDPSFRETLDNPNVHARNIRIGDESYIYLSNKVLSDPALTTLALGHELGHQLYSVAWDNLKPAAQQRLRDASNTKTDEDFNEWMADQLASWITQRRQPKGAVEAFFAKVGGQIRRLYEFMKGRKDDRFTLDQTFSDFADAVAQRASRAASPGANPLSDSALRAWFSNEGVTMYKFWGKLPQKDNMTIPEPRTEAAKAALKRIEDKYPAIVQRAITMRNWVFNAYRVAVAPSTSAVRTIGKRIKSANKLASIFNREKQGAAKKSQNYHQRVELMRGQFSDAYAKLAHLSVERKAEIARSLQAKDGKADQTFDADEQAMRNLFDAMHAYAQESGLPVRKIRNYFPRQFSREALVKNKQEILDHLTNVRNIPLAKARNIYNSLIDPNAQDGRATLDVTETPGFKAMNSRKNGVASDPFFDKFLDDNLDGITSNYLNSVVKRAEFNRLMGEAMPVTELDAKAAIKAGIWDPKAKMHKIIGDAKKEGATDEELVILEQYIDANLGQLGRDSALAKPGARRFMAGMMAYQNMRVLLFTVFASLPDLAGPAIRSGDMKGAWKSLKDNMHNLVNDDNELASMARAYGIISDAASDHIMTEYVDNHYMPAKLRKWNDGFFKWTGLNWYTDFTRKAALAVGVDYIQQQAEIMANPENEKAGFKARDALKELGLTKADVDAWVAQGKPTYDSISNTGSVKIAESLVQFVDESIMRPNASQRPILASHPGAMLVFHLKGYLYAVHDIILKRIKFNIDESDNPAQLVSAISPAIAMMLLTAVGLELRELIQYAGSNRKPPTDRMDGWEYTWELMQRSGLTGIAQLGIDLEGAEDRGLSHVAGIGGPTLSQAAQVLSKPSTQTIPKAIPVIGQLPAGRNAVRTVL